MNDIDKIKKVRELTKASLVKCKNALAACNGNVYVAIDWLHSHGAIIAAGRQHRTADEGAVKAYIHNDGKIGVLVEVNCETDFVARSVEFKTLCEYVAQQIVAMDPANVSELLQQEDIHSTGHTVQERIDNAVVITGEKIGVKRFVRYELGGYEPGGHDLGPVMA